MFPGWLTGETNLINIKLNFQVSTSIFLSLFGNGAITLLSISQSRNARVVLDSYSSLSPLIFIPSPCPVIVISKMYLKSIHPSLFPYEPYAKLALLASLFETASELVFPTSLLPLHSCHSRHSDHSKQTNHITPFLTILYQCPVVQGTPMTHLTGTIFRPLMAWPSQRAPFFSTMPLAPCPLATMTAFRNIPSLSQFQSLPEIFFPKLLYS